MTWTIFRFSNRLYSQDTQKLRYQNRNSPCNKSLQSVDSQVMCSRHVLKKYNLHAPLLLNNSDSGWLNQPPALVQSNHYSCTTFLLRSRASLGIRKWLKNVLRFAVQSCSQYNVVMYQEPYFVLVVTMVNHKPSITTI